MVIFAGILFLHVPDGFLSLGLALLCWVLALVVIGLAVRNGRNAFDERLIPVAGIMAAFIFAGQMINFPVAGGTSGHMIGATLAAIVLGPWLAVLVMTAVIVLQALLFQDGGLVVMGANILIMGVIPVIISYGLFRMVAQRSKNIKLATAGLAAWLSVMGAALVTALLLGFSGTSSFRVVVPAMLGIHAIIGLGEALITAAALSFIMRARPQLVHESGTAGGRGWMVGGVVVILLVLLISPFASSFPDGLEWVAQQQGFINAAKAAPVELLPDYTLPVLGDTAVSTITAGFIGALLVGLLVFGFAKMLKTTTNLDRPEVKSKE
ncbi:MAG: energy-coupling factor ABC transporter permease [Anaerolineales bacterium]|nr:energy-coupling factor ABC transporter permease [Anaerolineales bacterium]